MEIPWHLLDCKRAHQPATLLVDKRLFHKLVLLMHVGFTQNFEVPFFHEFAILVNSSFGNRTDIGMVRHQHVL